MIRIADINGQAHYLAASAIAQVTEAGPSSQWHGIRSFVKTFDGGTIEAQESAQQIAAAIDRAALPAQAGTEKKP